MKFFNWFKKESAVNRVITMYMPGGQGVAPRTDFRSHAEEGFGKNSVVYACVREIAEAAAGIPFVLYRKKKDGDLDEITQHPLLDLLGHPNPLQGRFEFIENAISFLELAGNTYIEKAGPERGAPRELYVLRPDRMRILPHRFELIAGYEYKHGGESVRFERGQIQHTKLFNPVDDLYGMSRISVAALAVDKMNEGDRWNANLLNNAAVPSGSLQTEMSLTDEEFRRLKEEMRREITGAGNARQPLLLEKGLTWKSMSATPREMDWIEGLKLSALQIAQVFNVPAELVGLQPATYQNRKEARKALYTEAVCPSLQRLIDGMNASLVPHFGKDLILAMNKDGIEALSEDMESLWKRANEAEHLTVNEKRELIGYEDIGPAGDMVLVPLNNLPLNDVVEGMPADQGEGADPVDDNSKLEDEGGKCRAHLIPVAASGIVAVMGIEGKAFSPKDRKRFQREFIEVARLRDRLAIRTGAKIKGLFTQERDLVIQAFRRGGQTEALDAVAAQEDRWREFFEDLHLNVIKRFGRRTLESLKFYDSDLDVKADDIESSIDFFESVAQRFARANAARAVTNVSGETRKTLRSVIAQAVEGGLGIDETVQLIKDKYAGFNQKRARSIARTETHNAQNEAQVESVRSLNRPDMEKGWLWSGVSRTEHAAVDGTWVPINERFNVPGADSPMDRPGDPAGGPQAVINCACTLVFRRSG